jgi:hypothetical protein
VLHQRRAHALPLAEFKCQATQIHMCTLVPPNIPFSEQICALRPLKFMVREELNFDIKHSFYDFRAHIKHGSDSTAGIFLILSLITFMY